MAHNIVLQARAHYLPYNVPLREKPEIIRKVLEKIEHLEKLCAEFSAVVHNKKDEKCSNNNKAVSFSKGKSSKKSMEKSTKYIPPPMRKKSKEEGKCWKCGDKYLVGHKCAFYTRNIIASNSEIAQKDDADSGKNNMEEGYHEQLVAVKLLNAPVNLLNAQAKEALKVNEQILISNWKQVARISDLVGLTQVKWLEVQNNGAAFDDNIDEKSAANIIQLETLRLTLTEKKSLPIIMTRMQKLKRLALKCPDLDKMEFIGIRNKKFDDFQSLSYLILFECGMLWKLPDLHKLKNLQRLEIITCRKLKEFPKEFAKTEAFSFLEDLSLVRLEKLEELPDIEKGAMPALQIFTIMECPALNKLPPRYLELKTLQKLRIYSCPLIAEDCEKK